MKTPGRFLISAFALTVTLAFGSAAERRVIVPKDTKLFTVKKTDFVRIAAQGIAGTKITAKVDGAVKMVAENDVTYVTKGKAPLGNVYKEFYFQPTKAGKATVQIIVDPPNAKAKTKTYKFAVQ